MRSGHNVRHICAENHHNENIAVVPVYLAMAVSIPRQALST